MQRDLSRVLAQSSVWAMALAMAAPAFAQDQLPKTGPTTNPTAEQIAASPDATGNDANTIVVTGTQIRGVTPAGSTLVTQTAAQAEEQGAVNGNEILAQIPQAANMFQNLPSIGGGGIVGGNSAASRLSFSSVTLRNLPNVNTGGGEFTLQIMDGHRIVPIGNDPLGGQGVDPSSIPATLLARTEVMPDGGSAIYGSNAVAGVINYITRDKFDGIRIQARGGIAGSYKQGDASITAGTSWSTGSVFATFAWSGHDALFGKDRDYIRGVDWDPQSPLYGKPIGLFCDNPNIAVTSNVVFPAGTFTARRLYPLSAPGGTIQPYTTNGGTNGNGVTSSPANGIAGGNRCDTTDYTSFYPTSHQYSAAFGLTQDLTDDLTFSVKGFWSQRKSISYQQNTLTATEQPFITSNGTVTNLPFQNALGVPSATLPAGGSATLPNPAYRPICTTTGAGGTAQCGVTPGFFAGDNTQTQTIFTNFGSALPRSLEAFVNVELWQVTPQLAWNFAPDWQLRAILSYGESKTEGINGLVDNATLTTRINNGTINPYNISASAPGAFNNLVLYDDRIGKFSLLDARVIADGPLLKLPAGQVRMAIGGEYAKTTLHQLQSITAPTFKSPTPDNFTVENDFHYAQKVGSVFGELQIPLIDGDMNIPLIHSLDVSASGRYDDYSDFGDTFNKLFGVTWGVTNWVKVRGTYSTSYAAPNLLTEIAAATGAIASTRQCIGNVPSCSTSAPLAYFTGFIPPGMANAIGGVAGTPSQGINSGTLPSIGLGTTLSNGTQIGIGPQRSRTWSVGIDFQPPIVPGLTLGMSYYDLKITGAIATALAPAEQSVFDFHPELILCHGGTFGQATPAACSVPLSLAELAAAGVTTPASAGGLVTSASLTNPSGPGGAFGTVSWPTIQANYCGPDQFPNCGAGTHYSVFYVLDGRQRNLGYVFARGIDFHASYDHPVSWGSVDFNLNGTVNLSTQTQANLQVAPVDVQAAGNGVSNVPTFRITASAGTNWGGFRGQVTWQHTSGFHVLATSVGTIGTDVVPGTLAFGQTDVAPYDTVDLFFRYDFDKAGYKDGFLKGLSLTLNINNVFDSDPPLFYGAAMGYTNGSTLGRLFQLGVTKDF